MSGFQTANGQQQMILPVKKENAAIKGLRVIGYTFLSLFLVLVITGCICAVALTIYSMQFAENSYYVDLEDIDMSFSSFVYAYDKDGKAVQLKQLNTDENRVWVDIEDIPQHTLDAVVATEDKRFYEHEGVDWYRTVGVTMEMFISNGTEGGSTITQQLVRNITKDTDVNIGRKLREIFRALAVERKYTKHTILEAYLNQIPFGGITYGIGSAAQHYFGKEVKDLTVAESAMLAGIIRSPSNFNPYASLENARERELYTLGEMRSQGYLSSDEYDEAKAEKIHFARPLRNTEKYFGYSDDERYNEYYGLQDGATEEAGNEDLYFEKEKEANIPYKHSGEKASQSWYTDAAIQQIVVQLSEQRGIAESAARELLYKGGYSIYLNVDLDMQDKLEKAAADPYMFLRWVPETYKDINHDLLQAGFLVMDYHGNVKAVIGGIGEKPGDNIFNRATQSVRAVGSTMKPIAVYGPAIDTNRITYSTYIHDTAGTISDGYGGRTPWPQNYEKNYGTGAYQPAWWAVQKSCNTIAVRTLSMVGLQVSYEYLRDRLGITTLDPVNDMAYSPLALGALSRGMKLIELAGAYQIYGNGGMYYAPSLYSKVVDSDGRVLLEQEVSGTQAIEKSTSWIVNRMMKKVIEDTSGAGTGYHAAIPNVEVVGKTGTANDMSNLLFVGLTPDYLAVYRIGYDDNHEIANYGASNWKTLATVWHDLMVPIVGGGAQKKTFTADSDVVLKSYCTETGYLATSSCPSTAMGYYKNDFLPRLCDSRHDGTYWSTHGDTSAPVYN